MFRNTCLFMDHQSNSRKTLPLKNVCEQKHFLSEHAKSKDGKEEERKNRFNCKTVLNANGVLLLSDRHSNTCSTSSVSVTIHPLHTASPRLSSQSPLQNSRKCHSSHIVTAPHPLFPPPTPPNPWSPKNSILPLLHRASPCPVSSFHSSASSSAFPAQSSPSPLFAVPDLCPSSDAADPKTLSGHSTRPPVLGSSEIMGAWWSALRFLGLSEFRLGSAPPIAGQPCGALGFLPTQTDFWGIRLFFFQWIRYLTSFFS